MASQRPTTPKSANSAESGTSCETPQFNDVEVTRDAEKPDDTYQEQSATKVSLLLASVMTSMFVVGLDRTIISTVWAHFS